MDKQVVLTLYTLFHLLWTNMTWYYLYSTYFVQLFQFTTDLEIGNYRNNGISNKLYLLYSFIIYVAG